MKKEFPVIGLTKIWLSVSSILVVASIVSVAIFGLNFGIDFTGGSLLEVEIIQPTDTSEIKSILSDKGFDVIVQTSEDTSYLIRLGEITTEQHDAINLALQERYEGAEELRFESVGPVIGSELKQKSITAMVILSLLIIAYVAWAFRKVTKPIASWKYGILTIVAALHDVMLPIGVFAILGHFWGYQIDTAFIAALLTIIGYSINDTIVVFDRTRENLVSNRHSEASFGDIVNKSVMQSFGRSINTSLTTLLVLVAIFIFGGTTTKPFILALIIGIVSGAYSSIFLASPLLVMWEKWKKR
ncbi:protein translocase subunit SecF [Patescibacteria group bacterium]|nr:protein translocase subunit SecF [Patescibacteria group bacterium]